MKRLSADIKTQREATPKQTKTPPEARRAKAEASSASYGMKETRHERGAKGK